MIAACSGNDGQGCGGAQQTSAVSRPAPEDPTGRLEATRQELAKRPYSSAAQDDLERAWLDAEFRALDEELKDLDREAAPLDFGGCPDLSVEDCIARRIGGRYDSTWTRAEVRDTAVLLLVFHARSDHEEDTESGNELVVFHGRLVSEPGAPVKLDLVSRKLFKVSDAVGTALGRRAVAPDLKDGDVVWGIRFEPLDPEAFALVDALPDAWVGLYSSDNGDRVHKGVPGNRDHWYILKEPELRMAWLSWSEQDGRFEPLPQVTKRWNTYHLGPHHRLYWKPKSEPKGYLARGDQEGKGNPYIPAKNVRDSPSGDPSPSQEEEGEVPEQEWSEAERALPAEVRGTLAACTWHKAEELKPGLYVAQCGCGNPCGYSTFVDVKGGRVSPAFWLPLGVDARGERVALSTEGKMPIRIVGMFDEQEWMVIRRPAGDATELSQGAEVTFQGNRVRLKYPDRRWDDVEEVVKLPRKPR
ncbi:hypothetical protein HPC49_12520 [Pyxidicoccus fallax]|uniref:Uncharacterized protein n=1 Tax=Pyxidicoccus fallax TaxID=394095 RepID=A0A848LPD9_9BACT|nr:hypothetical protein [Pyxidicoccus fallax]NMO19616.1 hypothetical protein [Pyxidicoccus fallax]NPC79059.1 hypothetical protein [Pyxidicoccus fallax]